MFANEAFANHEDGGSQVRHLIFFIDENSRFKLISGQSKCIKWIVWSILAAETLALSDGVDHAVYLFVLLKELHPKFKTTDIPIEIFTDNNLLYAWCYSFQKICKWKTTLNQYWNIERTNKLSQNN